MTILITGPSGAVGLPTIRHLLRRGARIRALTSKESSENKLKALGIETVLGDLTSDADVQRAMQGITSVMHIPPRFREDEAEIGYRVINAAKAAEAEHIVLCSVFHPQMHDLDHHRNKLLVEEAVIESGVPFTILQPAMFMQNLNVEWPVIRERGVYLRPYSPDRKMALVDTEDLGEAAARVLMEPKFRGGTYELCGPDQLTTAEMAEVLSQECGRPVRADKRSIEDWEAWAKERGWKPWSMQAYIKMCRHYDAYGYAGGNSLVLGVILGRSPGDFRTFVKRFLAAQTTA